MLCVIVRIIDDPKSLVAVLHYLEPWQHIRRSLSAWSWRTTWSICRRRRRWQRRRRRRRRAASPRQGPFCYYQNGIAGHSTNPGTWAGFGVKRADVRVRNKLFSSWSASELERDRGEKRRGIWRKKKWEEKSFWLTVVHHQTGTSGWGGNTRSSWWVWRTSWRLRWMSINWDWIKSWRIRGTASQWREKSSPRNTRLSWRKRWAKGEEMSQNWIVW